MYLARLLDDEVRLIPGRGLVRARAPFIPAHGRLDQVRRLVAAARGHHPAETEKMSKWRVVVVFWWLL